MLSLFKRSASADDFASVMWECTQDWPAKHGAAFREDFGETFDKRMDQVLDEMVYFLAFATDYAMWCQLEKNPEIRNSARRKFTVQIQRFAQEHRCPAIPDGEWLGDGLIWMPKNDAVVGEPLMNLQRRFDLYARSLSRRHEKSAGERAAHVLAAFCGTMDITFIVFATPLFLGCWNGVKNVLGSIRIKA